MYTKTKLNLILIDTAAEQGIVKLMFLEIGRTFPKLAELFRCTGRKFFWDLATLFFSLNFFKSIFTGKNVTLSYKGGCNTEKSIDKSSANTLFLTKNIYTAIVRFKPFKKLRLRLYLIKTPQV
jgi:hypothetical protein